MKAYEGMPAYEAGVKDGREELAKQFRDEVFPYIVNRLALVLEFNKEEFVEELINECIEYLTETEFETLPIFKGPQTELEKTRAAAEFEEMFREEEND